MKLEEEIKTISARISPDFIYFKIIFFFSTAKRKGFESTTVKKENFRKSGRKGLESHREMGTDNIIFFH